QSARSSPPEAKLRAVNPAERSRRTSALRTGSSSSRTAIIVTSCTGQREMKRRAAVYVVGGRHPPVVRNDDRTADGEPEPQSIALGRMECFEYALDTLRLDAGAAIGDRDPHFVRIARRTDVDTAVAWHVAGHGFSRVQQQVEQHLLDLHPVAEHGGQHRLEPGAHVDLTHEQVAVRNGQCVAYELGHVERLSLDL